MQGKNPFESCIGNQRPSKLLILLSPALKSHAEPNSGILAAQQGN